MISSNEIDRNLIVNQHEDVLEDSYISKSGKKYVYDWKGLKDRSLQVAESFRRLGMTKQAATVFNCGTFLEFIQSENENERMKLQLANFCKNRLCPMCMKRRQIKIFSQVSKVMDVACDMGDYDFLFLTLTHPNCLGTELISVLDNMYLAFKRFVNCPRVKRAFIGWYRALEVNFDPVEHITSNMYWGNKSLHLKARKAYYDNLGLSINSENPNYLKFHPHFHLILMVKKNYFVGRDYLSQESIAAMWARSLGVFGAFRQVFIEKIRSDYNIKKAVSEVAKYPVKDFDILVPGRDDLTDYAVDKLYNALYGRRLIGYGGVLREVYRQLGLSDPIDGDLVHIEDDKLRDDIKYIVKKYSWRVGATGYNYYLDKILEY